MNHKKPA